MSQPDPQPPAEPQPQWSQPGPTYEPPTGQPYGAPPSSEHQSWHPSGPQPGQAYDPLTGLPYGTQAAPAYDPKTGLPYPPQPGPPYGHQGARYEVPAGLPGYGPAYPQAGYPPVAYAQQPGYGPYWPRATNGMAIASLVLGIVWIYWIGSVLALVFGYVARQQIAQRGEAGGGMAVAGIVLGWIGMGMLALTMFFVFAVDTPSGR